MVTNNDIKCYSELIKLNTFEERFEYLLLNGIIGEETFGHSRYLNQSFYTSTEWRKVRDYVIVRDNGCDLASADFPIFGRIIVHHMIPITKEMVIRKDRSILDPEYLICVSHDTHNAITYHDTNYISKLSGPTIRKPNDTCPWKK